MEPINATRPPAKVTIRRLVIVDWLWNEGAKTGQALHEWLSSRTLRPFEVDYVTVNSGGELVAAVYRVAEQTPQEGNPIVHIEAHGMEGGTGLAGPNGLGGEEALSWAELAPALRALNLATRLNLVVVSAACFGQSALLAMTPEELVPFMALVGPSTPVFEGSILRASKELYRALSGDTATLHDAVAAAERELGEGERLTCTAWLDIVEGALERVLEQPRTDLVAALFGGTPPSLHELVIGGVKGRGSLERVYAAATIAAIDQLLTKMLGRRHISEAESGIRVNADDLLAEAISRISSRA